MKIRIVLLSSLLGLCFLMASAYGQEVSATRVKEKTEKSARFLQEEGESGLAAISDPESEWAKEPYLFVYDLDGNIIAHPNSKLIGKKFLGIKDVKGKMFPAEFVMVAKSEKGKGWVDYWWPKLKGGKPEQKVSYIMRVPGKDMLVGAGIYGYDAEKAEAEAGE